MSVSLPIVLAAVQMTVALAQAPTPPSDVGASSLFASSSRVEPAPLRFDELEFRDARLIDAIRVISEASGANIISTRAASESLVTIYLRNVTVEEAVQSICRVNQLWYRRDGSSGTYRIMTVEEYQKDLVVYRDDTIEVFELLNPNVLLAAQAIQDLFGNRVVLSFGLQPAQEQQLAGAGGLGGIGGGIGGGAGGLGGIGGRGGNRNFSGVGGRGGGNVNNRGGRGNFQNLNNFGGGRGGRGGAGQGNQADPEAEVSEDLTVDQLEALARTGRGVNQVSADQLAAVSTQAGPIYVTVNQEHNQIIVRTSDERALGSIGELIEKLDKPVVQVLLEMKILDVLIDDDFDSLFNFQFQGGDSGVIDASGNPIPRNELDLGNFASQGGSFVYQFLSESLLGQIELLETSNRINVIATPVITAGNNRPAQLFVGEETVLTTGVSTLVNDTQVGVATTIVQPETEVRQVGNTISITPFINEDGTVTLSLIQETSTITRDGANLLVAVSDQVQTVPIDTVNTTLVAGTVFARDGYTMAVGGLVRETRSQATQKVPVLGSIPILGTLFRRDSTLTEHRELVLLITPYILNDAERAEQITDDRILAPSRYSEWPNQKGTPPALFQQDTDPPGEIEEDLKFDDKRKRRRERRRRRKEAAGQ
ncbi:MAG: hypothetical protein AAGA68_12635 [Pseudomonadota bacterium]